MQINEKLKIFLYIFVAIPIILFITIAIYYKLNPDYLDICLDVGYCKEGLTLNDKGETFIINKETCLKHDGKWIDDGFCNFR